MPQVEDNVIHFKHWCNIIASAEVSQVLTGVMKLCSVGKAVYQIKRPLPDGTGRGTHGEERSNNTLQQTHFISRWLHSKTYFLERIVALDLPVKSWSWVHFSNRILISALLLFWHGWHLPPGIRTTRTNISAFNSIKTNQWVSYIFFVKTVYVFGSAVFLQSLLDSSALGIQYLCTHA